MLGQRRRRWASIGPALGQRLMFPGLPVAQASSQHHERLNNISVCPIELAQLRLNLRNVPNADMRRLFADVS